jgi:hypothetical protein
MTKDEWRKMREQAYDSGLYQMRVPDVTTGGWDKRAWINWVTFNDPVLKGYDDGKTYQIIRTADHPSNLDPTARIVNYRRDNSCVYSTRDGYLAVLEYPNCIAGLFKTERDAWAAVDDVQKEY